MPRRNDRPQIPQTTLSYPSPLLLIISGNQYTALSRRFFTIASRVINDPKLRLTRRTGLKLVFQRMNLTPLDQGLMGFFPVRDP